MEYLVMAKAKDLATNNGGGSLAAVEPKTGGMVLSGMEQTSGGDVMLGRLAMYNGTPTEEETYAGCDFRRGNWIDVMEKRKIADSAVRIVPVAVFPSWVRFDDGGGMIYSTRVLSEVPPADLVWPPNGQKNSDGKFGPLAAEVWNFVVLVDGEPWPYLLRLKRTALDAAKQIAQLEARYATNGTGHRLYELASKPDKNSAGQAYIRVTTRPVGTCPETLLATLATVKSQIAGIITRAQDNAEGEDSGGGDKSDDSLPI